MAVSQIREHYLGRMQAPPKFCAAFRCHTCRPGFSIDTLERENDAIALTRVRHEISRRLVEIRLLLRDGNLKGLNGGRT